MPMAVQAKLLRVLQEQEVEPLGSNRVERINVRVIAATSRDLPAMVAAGQFRADLFYRLNVLPLRLPPLRERVADLDALAEHLLDDIARRSHMPHKSLSAEALAALAQYPWPGNARELRNVLEQAALMSDGMTLNVSDLQQALPGLQPGLPGPGPQRQAAALVPQAQTGHKTLPVAVAELEAAYIAQALAQTGGNKQAAAKLLGIARATLYEKMAGSAI